MERSTTLSALPGIAFSVTEMAVNSRWRANPSNIVRFLGGVLRARAVRDFFVYEDAADAAQKILELHNSVELRTALATSARRLIETTLSWEFVGAQISRSARQMLADRGSEHSRTVVGVGDCLR